MLCVLCIHLRTKKTYIPIPRLNNLKSLDCKNNFCYSADTFYHDSFTKDFRVHVKHDGHITWAFGGNLATTCELDMTYYPFDRQHCKIELENWSYDGRHVNLTYKHDYIDVDNYHVSGLWEMEKTSVQRKDLYYEAFGNVPFPEVIFNIYLQRKSAYYGMNIIVPLLLMIMIALLVFWLPADSGEKIGLAITVLLAMSVFLVIVSDSTPKNSDFQPIMCKYLFSPSKMSPDSC